MFLKCIKLMFISNIYLKVCKRWNVNVDVNDNVNVNG